MSERAPFADFPVETRRFYATIIYIAMLNAAAVKHGMFDTLLCDTDDDLGLYTWFRFYDQIPVLRVHLGLTMPEVDKAD